MNITLNISIYAYTRALSPQRPGLKERGHREF